MSGITADEALGRDFLTPSGSGQVRARVPATLRAVAAILRRNWVFGALTLVLPSGEELVFEGTQPGPRGELIVRDLAFLRRVMAAGDIGFGEGYMAGEWDSPDIAALLEAFSQNLDKIDRLLNGNPVMRGLNAVRHRFRRNSRTGSRRNIEAHYDLGNAFYERWLDPGMTYSSALFAHPGQSLEEAQTHKYASLAKALDIQPGHRVLEIGCGWGGFAQYCAQLGAHVTGITLSQEQHAFARARLEAAGLSDRTHIRLVDYRDVTGQFDRIASIEMFEAVGEQYWPAFFGQVQALLRPGGVAGMQVITIDDALFDHYRGQADFIQKYVFPGGMLPSERRLRQQVEAVGLTWTPVVRFGHHYADTLAQWADRFRAVWGDVAPLGFDERFRRLWLFYLGYCEAGFRTDRIDVMQFTAAKG